MCLPTVSEIFGEIQKFLTGLEKFKTRINFFIYLIKTPPLIPVCLTLQQINIALSVENIYRILLTGLSLTVNFHLSNNSSYLKRVFPCKCFFIHSYDISTIPIVTGKLESL